MCLFLSGQKKHFGGEFSKFQSVLTIGQLLSRYLSLHFNIPSLKAIIRENKLNIEILLRCAHRIYGSCYSGRECFPYFNRKSNTLLKGGFL